MTIHKKGGNYRPTLNGVVFFLLFMFLPLVRAEEKKPVSLTLEESVRLALKQSPDVMVVQSENSRALLDRQKTLSKYWPTWKSDINQYESTAPSVLGTQTGSTATTHIKDDQLNYSSGLFETLPTNTQIFTRFSTIRTDTNSADVLVSPYYFSRLEFGGSQPLLRGMDWFGTYWGGNWSDVKIASRNKNVSEQQFRNQLSGVISEVEQSYWNTIAAKDVLAAREEALQITEKQIEGTQKKIDAGLVVAAEMFQVSERKASRTVDLLMAKRDYAKAKTELAGKLNIEGGNADTIEASESLAFSPYPISKEELLKRIEVQSPTLLAKRESMESAHLSFKQAKSTALPILNVKGSYFLNGGNTVTNTGYHSDIDELLGGDSKGYQVGAVLEVPLGPGPEYTDYKSAHLNYIKAEAEFRVEEIRVRSETLKNYEEVQAAIGLIKQAEERVDLANKKLDFEQKKFEAGRTTAFNLLQFQEDLADARVKRVESILQYLVAATALDRLVGRTLEKFNINVAEENSLWTPQSRQP